MGDVALFLKEFCSSRCCGIGFSRGASWLLQLAAHRRLFDKLVLIAPYPPLSMDELTCAERLTTFLDMANIIAIGAPTDGHACTPQAHPAF